MLIGHTHFRYPYVHKELSTPTPTNNIQVKSINDYPQEMQDRWNNTTGYIEPKKLVTTASQRKMHQPGVTKWQAWERK